jgi:quercetin dioxygenase-like cupin family protein
MSFSGPGEGTSLEAGGNRLTVKIHPDTGAQDFSLLESIVPPGGGVFPHLHREYEEAFYVLNGSLDFLLGTEWHAGGAGTAVHVPRGVVHAFRNSAKEPARLLVVHTPARAIQMIEELAAVPQGSSPAHLAAVLARHASEPARTNA